MPPGKTTNNTHTKSFNGSLRSECLNMPWFDHLIQYRTNTKTGAGNTIMRGHISSLNDLVPIRIILCIQKNV
ncbi:hypothetical protein EGH51_25150 [Klebsiella aerogenes]|uniref:integrase core domain-containing protein n=1 Tax=Klebsiella aerogenes TaxID=548 RepID=UPI000F7E3248|nr:hypothetical protein EGH51_25150 [Klebsiella aerogenes]